VTAIPRSSPPTPDGPGLLRAHLDALRADFGPEYRERDPVRFAHRYATPADREAAAFLSALLAFGQVEVVLRNLEDAFARLGPRPAETLRGIRAGAAKSLARGFRHRWIGETELGRLFAATGRLLSEHGSLEAAFAAGDSTGLPSIRPGLAGFAARALRAAGRPRDRAMKFLFPSPDRGGACKRLNLFLRWVVRPADGIDLGLWRTLAPARLVIPLDTHVAFHARVLGLSRRRTADWRMAEEVTAKLAEIDAADPVRYDFALCHLGIHGECRKRRDPEICPRCPIDALCRLPRRRASR
jgi:uncharacterized protein (TIGR02757 family)